MTSGEGHLGVDVECLECDVETRSSCSVHSISEQKEKTPGEGRVLTGPLRF